jgi:tRNA pseudouridine55 synthase
MYSALKVKGQPLYKLARQGVSIERAARPIEIHVLELLGYTALTVRVRVECSKGTYIRTLVEQLGVRLGSCAHVTGLRRDFVEPFRGEAMRTLEQLQADAPRAALLPADRAVAHLPEIHLSLSQARALSFGQAISGMVGAGGGQLRLYDPSGRFLGLGMGMEGDTVRPLRLFAAGAAGPS